MILVDDVDVGCWVVGVVELIIGLWVGGWEVGCGWVCCWGGCIFVE